MRLSIIIPTCDRPQDLKACLSALREQAAVSPEVDFEIIVSDDGRKHPVNSSDLSSFGSVIRVQGPQRGPAANRNLGASIASGDVLVFLDDDCLPQNGFLQTYWAYWNANDCELLFNVYGPTIPIGERYSLLFEAPDNSDGKSLISANFSIPKKAFLWVGGFDERYPNAAFEDTEFFERFSRCGGQSVFLASAVVLHPFRKIASPRSLAKKWEAKVIYALDLGASPLSLYGRFPWHALRVIMSRFRNQCGSPDVFRAGVWFLQEWIWVLLFTPRWIAKWSRKERSSFWSQRDHSIPKHGL